MSPSNLLVVSLTWTASIWLSGLPPQSRQQPLDNDQHERQIRG
jgi:hypothetical protein